MILSIGQAVGALTLAAGLYLAFGIPVALVAAGSAVLVVCTLAELVSDRDRVRELRAERDRQSAAANRPTAL